MLPAGAIMSVVASGEDQVRDGIVIQHSNKHDDQMPEGNCSTCETQGRRPQVHKRDWAYARRSTMGVMGPMHVVADANFASTSFASHGGSV